KDFEKRVKECLKLSGGKRIGAGDASRSGRGPVRIGAAAKARAVDMPVEMPSRRSWLAAARSWHRPAGTPFGPS
ncbi:hypothetical protein Tco_0198727, partial [Tanacetum coccineum]